jgi:hypothetical protein
MNNPKLFRQNFMRFLARSASDLAKAYEFSRTIQLQISKKDSNALQFVMEDFYRKALKSQEFYLQEHLKLISEFLINEDKKWELLDET